MTGTVADDDPIWRGGEESARSQGGANGEEPTGRSQPHTGGGFQNQMKYCRQMTVVPSKNQIK